MAEEIVSQETESVNPPGSQNINDIALNRIREIESSLNLPARPTAIDSYKNIAGNPITGSNPGSKNQTSSLDYVNSLDNSVRQNLSSQENEWGALRPFTYNGDYDGAKFDRYHSSGDLYNKLGFSPYRDNESLYNEKMTFGDEFVRAAKQWDNLVGVGFMSGVRSWKTMFTDPLAPDIEGARDMNRIMTTGGSQRGGVGGFFVNTFLNSGYTVGIGLNFLGEELALMGATAVTGGIMGAANVPTMVGRGLNAINKAFEGTKAAFTGSKEMRGIREMGETIPEMRTWWNTVGQGAKSFVKETADILNPLDQTFAALKAGDYATDYAKVAKTFGAFADDMLLMKNTVSEAKLEAGMIKIDLTNTLIQEYRAKFGSNPDQAAMADIEKKVDKEAYNTALWNLPAINTTNKLMYAAVFSPLKNVMGKEGTANLIEDYLFKNKKFTALGEGIFDKGKAALQSFKNPKFYGQFGMNYLKANVAEGVQENLQDMISKAASDHAVALFKDPIRATYEGYMPHVIKSFSDQFSAQGAETFAGGLAMGLFAGPVMGGVSVSMGKLINTFGTSEYEANKKINDEIKARNVEHLNLAYDNALNFFGSDLPNAIKTGRLADDLQTAARVGNKKEALDALENIKNNYILTTAKLGKLDIIIDKLKEYGNMTKSEATEAFAKYGIEEKDVDKALGKMTDVIARAERFKDEYADVAEKYPNPFNPSKFAFNSPEHASATIAKEAWDTATYNLMFAKATYETHSKRVAEVAQIFSAISDDLAKSDAQNLMSLLSPNTTKAEIGMLQKEISVLDESLPEQKKIKAEKTKQLETLTNFSKAIEKLNSAKTEDEKSAAEVESKKAFLEYVKFLAKKNDNIVFNEEINKAYSVVRDHMTLKDEMKNLARNINVLMAPQNFFDLHTKLTTTLQDLFNDRTNIINNNQAVNEKIKHVQEFSNFFTEKTGLYVPNELLEAYSEAIESGKEMVVPTYFLDPVTNEKITSGEKFDLGMDLWNKFVAITHKVKVEEPVTEEGKKETVTALKNQSIEDTLNDILNEEGLNVPKEFINYYYDSISRGLIAPIPNVFINSSGEKITSGANFNKAVDKWKNFINDSNLKRLLMKPRETLTPAEEKALKFGLPGSSNLAIRKDFIEKKINILEKKADALGLDAIEITDTLNYLNDILKTSVDGTYDNIKQIDKQLEVLINSIKSKGAKKTARGVKALEKITELKLSYRSEFQLLNDITDRIKELQEELSDIEAVQKDLQKQASYYNSMLSDSSLSTYSREELTARRDKLNGKINTISRLLDAVKKAIYDSIRYIREHVNALFQANKNLKTFISENEYENFHYPSLKNKLKSLENEALNNMESVEFLEEVKASEEIKQAQLLEALLNYQDQVRYLEELIYNYKEGEIKDKFKDMNLNTKEIVDEKQAEHPVTISRKNARIERRIKEAKAQLKEVEQAESVVVTPEVSTITPSDIVSEFVLEEPTTQELNIEINLENLKIAKAYDYQVIYDNIQYKIEKIGTNSVTLKSALGKKEVINDSGFKNLRIVKPGIKEATVEENETIKANEKLVSEKPKEFEKEKAKKLTVGEYKTLFKKSICKG
jgi:hypothetical protein